MGPVNVESKHPLLSAPKRIKSLGVMALVYRGSALGSWASVDNLIPHCGMGTESCQISQTTMVQIVRLPMATKTFLHF